MRLLTVLLLTLFMLGCSEEAPRSYTDAQTPNSPVTEVDECQLTGSQYHAAGLEFGTNSYKGFMYVVDNSGRNRAVKPCDEIIDQSWSSTISYTELADNSWSDVQALSTDCGNNIFAVVSRGFQNTYDIPTFKRELTRVGFKMKYIKFLTGAEEAKLEWRSLTGADPDAVSLGVGGGSLQLGSSGQGFSVAIGSKLSEGSTDEEIKQIVRANPVPRYMKSKDYVSLTGGAAWISLCIAAEAKISSDDGYVFKLRDLEVAYEVLSNPHLYTRSLELYDIPNIGLSRDGIRLSCLAIIEYLKQLGIEDIRLSPRRSWIDIYVQELANPPGFVTG